MQRSPVVSTTLRAVAYDEVSKTLEVEFQNGSVYRYHGVPEVEYTGFMRSPSLGGYLRQHIRGKYRDVKVG